MSGKSLLDEAIELARSTPGMMIDGKRYTQVKDRIEIFRKIWGLGYSIETAVLTPTPYKRGDYILFKAVIKDIDSEKVVATGHACEVVGATEINVTSFVEAGETSAIGRALAAFGLHGGEYPSYEEMKRIGPKKEAIGEAAGRMFDELAITHPSRQMAGYPIQEVGRNIPEINTTPAQVVVSNGADNLSIDDLQKVHGAFERAIKMVASSAALTKFWTDNETTLDMLQNESDDSRNVYAHIKELFKKRGYELSKGE